MKRRVRKLLKDVWNTASGKAAVIGGVFMVLAAVVHGCFELSKTALEAQLKQQSQLTRTHMSQQYSEDMLSAILGCPTPEPLPLPEPGKIYIWKWEFRGVPMAPTFSSTGNNAVQPYPAQVFWLLENRILEKPELPARAYYLYIPGPAGQVPCESAGRWVISQ